MLLYILLKFEGNSKRQGDEVLIFLRSIERILFGFQFRGFYDIPRVLIADARSFQALAAILDSRPTRSHAGLDPMADKMNFRG